MKCASCPLYSSWSNESDSGEACGLFGDAWDNALQYEDKEGAICGCYVDRHFIEKRDAEYDRELEHRVQWYLEQEGKWINNMNGTFECDRCGCKHSRSNFCPNCGADMRA